MTETTGTLADFDRDFDAKTLALATAPNQAAIIAALGPDAERYASDTESLYAFAFGHMRERARVTLERLRAAESRVAELEAERDRPRVTGRDVLLGSMGTGNVNDDDEESLDFADESEWMDEPDYDARERAHHEAIDAQERAGLRECR